MNWENFLSFFSEMTILDFLRLNHALMSIANGIVKNNQLIHDPVPPERTVSKFSECQAINKTCSKVGVLSVDRWREKLGVDKKTHMLRLRIDSTGTELEIQSERSLQYYT